MERKLNFADCRGTHLVCLEHLKKFCSRLRTLRESGLFEFWLRFGSVAGRTGHAPSPKPRQNSKILAANGYRISLNALAGLLVTAQFAAAAQDTFTNDAAIKKFLHDNFDGGDAGMVIGLVDEHGSRIFSAGKPDNGITRSVAGHGVRGALRSTANDLQIPFRQPRSDAHGTGAVNGENAGDSPPERFSRVG